MSEKNSAFEKFLEEYGKYKNDVDSYIISFVVSSISQHQSFMEMLQDVEDNLDSGNFKTYECNDKDQLKEQLINQISIRQTLVEQLFDFLSNDDITPDENDTIIFLLFKVQYFSRLSLQFSDEPFDSICLLQREETKMLIQNMMENYKSIYLKADVRFDREKQQNQFAESIKSPYLYSDFHDFQQQMIAQPEINQVKTPQFLMHEIQFILNYNEVLQFLSNQKGINEIRNNTRLSELYPFLQYLLMDEISYNPQEKFNLIDRRFFDKYMILDLIQQNINIQLLEQEELEFLFHLLSILKLLNIQMIDQKIIEDSLQKIISRLQAYNDSRINSYLQFSIFYTHDLQIQRKITQKTYESYQEWLSKDNLIIPSNWINRQQFQLFIDTLKNVHKAIVVPDMMYFCNEIPFYYLSMTPTDIYLQIIYGKYLNQNHKAKYEDQLAYWLQLQDNVDSVSKYEQILLQNDIISINKKIIQIQYEQLQQNEYQQELLSLIDSFLSHIDPRMHQSIIDKEQMYSLLGGMLINESEVLEFIRLRLKNSFQDEYKHESLYMMTYIPSMRMFYSAGNFIIQNIFDYPKISRSWSFSDSIYSFSSQFAEFLYLHCSKQFDDSKQKLEKIIKDYYTQDGDSFITFYINLFRTWYQIYFEWRGDQEKLNLQQLIRIQQNKDLDQSPITVIIEESGQKYLKKSAYIQNDQDMHNFMNSLRLIDEISLVTTINSQIKTSSFINLERYEIRTSKESNNKLIELSYSYHSHISLQQYLQSNISNQIILQISKQILECHQSLHEKGIVHNNIALESYIVISQDPLRIQLIDFSKAKLLYQKCQVNYSKFNQHNQNLISLDYFQLGCILISVIAQQPITLIDSSYLLRIIQEYQGRKQPFSLLSNILNENSLNLVEIKLQIQQQFGLKLFRLIKRLFKQSYISNDNLINEILQELSNLSDTSLQTYKTLSDLISNQTIEDEEQEKQQQIPHIINLQQQFPYLQHKQKKAKKQIQIQNVQQNLQMGRDGQEELALQLIYQFNHQAFRLSTIKLEESMHIFSKINKVQVRKLQLDLRQFIGGNIPKQDKKQYFQNQIIKKLGKILQDIDLIQMIKNLLEDFVEFKFLAAFLPSDQPSSQGYQQQIIRAFKKN